MRKNVQKAETEWAEFYYLRDSLSTTEPIPNLQNANKINEYFYHSFLFI